MFDRFDEHARKTLFWARTVAAERQHQAIELEDLLRGLVILGGDRLAELLGPGTPSVVTEPLESDPRDGETIAEATARARQTSWFQSATTEIPFSASARRAIQVAVEQADQFRHDTIRIDHLALGVVLADEADTLHLRSAGVRPESLRASIGPDAARNSAPEEHRARSTQHIGIVACSAEGAALCYRTICAEGATLLGRHAHPEVSMHTYPLAEYMQYIERNDWRGVAGLMRSSAGKLASIGADFFICPDNTIHEALQFVEPTSPRPWLHIAGVVADEARRRGFRRLGLTGTRWLVESDVYPAQLTARGIEYLRPTAEERERINRHIFDELVNGLFTPDAVACFQRVMTRMQAEGCDAVVLGCTEIPLIMHDGNSPLPTLDSTRLLARAALQRAVSATEQSS